MRETKFIAEDSFKDAEEYWLDKLSGELNEIKILGDFTGSQTYEAGTIEFVLEEHLKDGLVKISKNNDLSLYIILLSVLKILLFKYTEQTDIVAASPIYTTDNREFNQYVVLRDEVTPHMEFKELLMNIKETVVGAYKKEHFPLKDLIDFLDITDGSSLYRIIILLENIHQKELVGDLPADLAFSFRKTDEQLELDIRYNANLFRKETIEQVFLYYSRILSQVVSDTKKEIGDIELMTESEKKTIVFQLNNTQKEYPKDKTVDQLFEEQTAKVPNQIAVSVGLDLSDIYEELGTDAMNPNLVLEIKKCFFKRNLYIYQREFELPGCGSIIFLLKTHRHNSVIVNKNTRKLLELFDGERNVKSLFSSLKEKNFQIIILPVNPDDILEISVTLGETKKFHLNGTLESFIGVVKSLYKYHLIELEGIDSYESPLEEIPRGYFEEKESAYAPIFSDRLMRQSNELSRAQVLLLGDTPGMPSIGLLYLASYLRRNGIKCYCQFNDLNWEKVLLEKNLLEVLKTIQPEVVAISLKWFLHIARVLEICRIIKSYSPDIKVVVGGNTASYYWEELISNESIDYIIKGDGEEPLLKICQQSDYIPNSVYKNNGKIINNPITYVQDEKNSSEIYLSHLDEILFSKYAPVFSTFFIYAHKGCGMNCIYCGGCREAHQKIFNRSRLFIRPIETVRKDIIAAKKYTSTFMFDFDMPNNKLLDFCKKIWEGIDLTSNFCIFTNLIPPTLELIKYVNETFKYVYWNLDIASLSEGQRMRLAQMKLVKPQISDEQILTFFDECEKFRNNEIRINTIAGLPYFTSEDIAQSEKMISHLIDNYSCMSELHWARLHAQPGAPIVKNAQAFQMHSNASTFKDFLTYSRQNFSQNTNYPNVENFVYPYIYFNDDRLNSRVSRLYSEINFKIGRYLGDRRKKPLTSKKISYKELNHKSHQLAVRLRNLGVKTDSIVGIIARASIEMVIGILGTLKAGCAYLPIDPDYPVERKRFMLKDSAARICMTQEELLEENRELLKDNSLENILIIDDETIDSNVTPDLTTRNKPNQPTYIIYTSGTTGNPKGVLVEHKGVVNYTCYRLDTYRYTEKDRTLQLLSYSFDGFGSNFFSSLLSGGGLFMVPDSRKMDFNYIRDVIYANSITNISLVPGMFRALLEVSRENDIQSLRFVVLAGEKADDDLIRMSKEKNPHILLINEYGPTETTVAAAVKLGIEEGNTAVIGTPISNIQTYILDRSLNHMPQNIQGELCISGIGVSRGYLNQPELNAEKFYPNPFIPGERMYRTGDMARRRTDGNIEFLGRKDDQIKVRGYRIELEEIERQLLAHEMIKEAVVLSKKVISDEPSLCAYIVSEDQSKPETSEVKEYLFRNLPYYMVPLYFIHMERIPLTMNGKIDKKGLPDPEIETEDAYVAPRNKDEERLSQIWSEVLKIEKDKIGIYDNFFELGGHSLMATILAARIHKEFHVDIKLVKIFELPTISHLIEYIKGSSRDTFFSIEPAGKKDYYLLSPAQWRLYFLHQMKLDSTAYNNPQIVSLEGELDRQKIKRVFETLIHRHESLRTSFHVLENQPIQKIHEPHEVEFAIEYYDAKRTAHSAEPEEGRSASFTLSPANIIKNFIRPFDLYQVPLLRVGLIKEDDQKHILMVDMHHIISDGTSLSVLTQDFMTLFSGQQLPPLRLQYKDYSEWQDSELQRELIKKQEKYWLKQFGDEIPVLNLPTDYPRPTVQSFEGSTLAFELSAERSRALNGLVLNTGTTLYMVLLAVYNVLLYRLSGQEDIILGTPTASRRHVDLKKIIGMFVNTLAMRNFPQGNKRFIDFVEEIKTRTLSAFENQEYQFEDLVEKLAVNRDVSRNPLFDVMFALQNIEISEVEIPGLKLKPYEFENKISKFDLTLQGFEAERKIIFTIEYSTKLFKRETIQRLSNHLVNLIQKVCIDPGIRISEIEILTEEEKHQLVYRFNDTVSDYPKDRTIHKLFEEQVERRPDGIAVVGQSPWRKVQSEGKPGEERHRPLYKGTVDDFVRHAVTYCELNRESNHLARVLIEKGVKPDSIVGVMGEPSIELVISILGILKSEGAYLPIDPGYPLDRINYMLADSGASALFTTRTLAREVEKLRSWEGEKILLDVRNRLPYPPAQEPSTITLTLASRSASSAGGLAYVIYTSGTMGKPKGVMVEHRSLVNLSFWHNRYYSVRESDHATKFAGIGFDASVWEIFPYLIKGASLYIVSESVKLDIEALNRYYERNDITIGFLPTQLCEQFMQQENRSLRKLLTGGDRLRIFYKRRYDLYNNYGPTENTVVSSACKVGESGDNIPIGRPIDNNRIYILEKNGMYLQPIGVPGELCIAGDSLARGYLHDPVLTSEKFVDNPIVPGERIYKTGDLVRWLSNGNIEFLGRLDQQVNIRGFRIELGEIETHLLKHDLIREVVVIDREDRSVQKYLCAYIVWREAFDLSELNGYLARNLPDFMIPAYFIKVDKIPVTPNGKLDRKTLPVPEVTVREDYSAPRNDTEEKLINIWSEVLTIDKEILGIDDSFFELGGHSLKATIMTSMIHKELNVKVPLADIFRYQTVRKLSDYIKSAQKARYVSLKPVEKKEFYSMSSAQKRMYVMQQMNRESIHINSTFAFQLEGPLERQRLDYAFHKLIERHEILRTAFYLKEEEYIQKIHPSVPFKVEYSEVKTPGEARKIIRKFVRPFAFDSPPLVRAGLVKVERERHLLMIDMHHITTDGTSMGILYKDLASLYEGRQLVSLTRQYKDFAQWQNEFIESGGMNRQKKYWLKVFEKDVQVLDLSTDFPRPDSLTYEGGYLNFDIGKADTEALQDLAFQEDATLFMVLLAVLYVLLSKESGQEDIVVGSPVAGRKHEDTLRIIGMFSNFLALRNYPDKEKTFREFLKEVRGNVLAAIENQDYPFEELVKEVSIAGDRDSTRNPLFDTIFAFQNTHIPKIETAGVELKPYEFEESGIVRYDMEFHGSERGENLFFKVGYRISLFKEKTIKELTESFKNIVRQVVKNLDIKLSQIELMSEEERERILSDFNIEREGGYDFG